MNCRVCGAVLVMVPAKVAVVDDDGSFTGMALAAGAVICFKCGVWQTPPPLLPPGPVKKS